MDLKKSVKIFGKIVPVWALATIALAGIASATLLTFYGQIVSTQNVNQAIRLDGMVCLDQYGTGCTENPTFSDVEGKTILDSPHTVKNFASISASGQINSASSCSGVAPGVTTDITESSSADDYSLPVNGRVSIDVSGVTLSQLVAQTLSFTDDVSNPLYTPNINIYLANGDIVQAWGSTWSGTNPYTVSFSTAGTIMGYGATVNPALGAANSINGGLAICYGSPAYCYYTSQADLLTDFGSQNVVKVEVRTQAGAAGGQVDRITQLVANGLTVVIPNLADINGQSFTMQPGESFSFGVSTTYPINMLQGTCTQTTQVVPA